MEILQITKELLHSLKIWRTLAENDRNLVAFSGRLSRTYFTTISRLHTKANKRDLN